MIELLKITSKDVIYSYLTLQRKWINTLNIPKISSLLSNEIKNSRHTCKMKHKANLHYLIKKT